MEVLPGIGLPVARLGQTLDDIVAAAGPADAAEPHRASWTRHSPPFDAYFDGQGRSELIEVRADEGLTLGGVQLNLRLMDDVAADLARSGLTGRRATLVVDFDEGFTLWSLGELTASDVVLGAEFDPDDDRIVLEGVTVGARGSG